MSYASKKSAVRAARKSGLEIFDIVENEGQWDFVVPEASNENENVADENVTDENVNDATGDETPTEPVTETVEIVYPADEATPFKFMWAFLDLNPSLPRKQQIAAMIDYGFNGNTVKTQVSRYNSVGGDKALWLYREKMKRDAYKQHINELAAQIKADREQAEADAKAEDSTDENLAGE